MTPESNSMLDHSDVLLKRQVSMVSLDGFAKVIVRPEVLLLLYIAAILHAWIVHLSMEGHWYSMDFSVYYTSALALRQGLNPYTTNIIQKASRIGLDINAVPHATDPPTFLLCFEPLTLLQPQTAYWTWIGINIVALVLSLSILTSGRGISRGSKLAIIALVVLYPPVASNFVVAQSKIPLLLCFAMMMRFLEENEIAAGFCLSMAVMLRGYPLIAAGYLICRRQWRVIFYMFAGLAIGGLITLFICGFSVLFSFVTDALGSLNGGEWVPFPSNFTLGAFISRQFWIIGDHPVFVFNGFRIFLVLISQSAVLCASVMATVKNASRADRDWRALCLWLITATFLSPIGYMYDLVLAIPLIIQLVIAASHGDASRRAIWCMIGSYLIASAMGDAVAMLYSSGIVGVVTPIVGTTLSQRIWMLTHEYLFLSLLLAYLSAYFFAVDDGKIEQANKREAVDSEEIARLPSS